MPTKSPEFDAYITAAAPFARPILKRIRRAFHRGCPRVVEVIKWGAPHFEHHGLLGSMAAFKEHVRFGFWRGDALPEASELFRTIGKTTMIADRVMSVDGLPDEAVLVGLVQAAAAYNESGSAQKKPAKKKPAETVVSPELQAALQAHPVARAAFEAFSPSHRREYVEWIAEAKQPATRDRRIAKTIEQLSQGLSRHWKYRTSGS